MTDRVVLEVLSFAGTRRAIGRAHGEQLRESIRELYDARVQNALGQAKAYGGRDLDEATLLAVAGACLGPTRDYDPASFEELEGIAEGCGLGIVKVLAMNGLTDLRDVLAWGGDLEAFSGCTAFVVQRDRTREGEVALGQTWDLATDNMPHVVAIARAPNDGPRTWSLTTAGCLSLIGMNDAGLAVGTTNIRTTDARAGVTYLSIIHRALHGRRVADVVRAVREADRAGAHFYYAADAEGRAIALETAPGHVDEAVVERGDYVHTNHCLAPDLVRLEGDTPVASSHARYERMGELLAAKAPLADLRHALGDTKNGSNAICRYDYGGISSNGAVLMAPERQWIVACHGPPDADAIWVDLRTGKRAFDG